MANEIMTVPEQYIIEVIKVIRTGLAHVENVPEPVIEGLKEWCNSHESYQDRLRQAKDTKNNV